MIELFRNPNYDFLGKAKYFIGFSVMSWWQQHFNGSPWLQPRWILPGGTKVTVRFVSRR